MIEKILKDINNIQREVNELLESDNIDVMIDKIYKINNELEKLKTRIYFEVENE